MYVANDRHTGASATWVLSLAGLFGLGAMLRSSRRKQLDAVAAT
jgi:hypothetical protein